MLSKAEIIGLSDPNPIVSSEAVMNNKSKVKIYPNPTESQLLIQAEKSIKRVEIFNRLYKV